MVNGDGIIARSEITLTPDVVYLGNPLPTHQFGFTPTLTLTRCSRFRPSSTTRWLKLFNLTRRFRCTFFNCQEAYDKTTPFADQAAAIAASALGTDAGLHRGCNLYEAPRAHLHSASPRSRDSIFRACDGS